MLARAFIACACLFLCVAANGAATHSDRHYDADSAMSCWKDAKVRQTLVALGMVGGHYKAVESGGQVLVEAAFGFKGGGKVSYRKYHAKDKGFPGPLELVRLYKRVKASGAAPK